MMKGSSDLLSHSKLLVTSQIGNPTHENNFVQVTAKQLVHYTVLSIVEIDHTCVLTEHILSPE